MGLAAMLYRTNLLALTSTTPPPAHAASRVTHSMHTAHHSLGGGGQGPVPVPVPASGGWEEEEEAWEEVRPVEPPARRQRRGGRQDPSPPWLRSPPPPSLPTRSSSTTMPWAGPLGSFPSGTGSWPSG